MKIIRSYPIYVSDIRILDTFIFTVCPEYIMSSVSVETDARYVFSGYLTQDTPRCLRIVLIMIIIAE